MNVKDQIAELKEKLEFAESVGSKKAAAKIRDEIAEIKAKSPDIDIEEVPPEPSNEPQEQNNEEVTIDKRQILENVCEEMYSDEPILFADGFDDAIVGLASRMNLGPVVAYDVDKCIDILVERDGMDRSEALEYFEFNVTGAWMGDYTPLFINTVESMFY